MNWIEKIKDKFFSWFEPKVNWNKIDKSFLVFSDWSGDKFVEWKGHLKGWVIGKDRVVIAAHCFPAAGQEIFIYHNGAKVKRKIALVLTSTKETDIAICTVDEPWPDTVKIYGVASKVKENQKAIRFHQDRNFSELRLDIQGDVIEGKLFHRKMIAGDSGLPWVVWDEKAKDFRVASHTHRGQQGFGPNYSELL